MLTCVHTVHVHVHAVIKQSRFTGFILYKSPSPFFPQIREASQALLQAELRRIQSEGRKKLVMEWASRLQSPAGYRGSGEKGNRLSAEDGDFSFGELGSEYTGTCLGVLCCFALNCLFV